MKEFIVAVACYRTDNLSQQVIYGEDHLDAALSCLNYFENLHLQEYGYNDMAVLQQDLLDRGLNISVLEIE